MLFCETKHKEPQVGKTVDLWEICPEFKKKDSPFASLIKDGCSSCGYAECKKKEGYEYAWTYTCAYPNLQNENQTKNVAE